MTIDKGLYAAPGGEDPLAELSIDISPDASETTNPDGSVDIILDPKEQLDAENAQALKQFDANLADLLPEGVVTQLGSEIISLVDADVQSRKDWTQTYVDGLNVIGLKYEERTEPWDGACGVYSSLLLEAAIRFQADTIMETFPATGPVKTEIIGELTPEKQKSAERVSIDMNYQLTERMSEYRPEHERLLFSLSLAGSAFKKVYKDPFLARQVSMFIPAEDVVVPYGASNIETAERVTHILRKTKTEMAKMQADEFYSSADLPEPTMQTTDVEDAKAALIGESYNATTDNRYQLYECHLYLHIEEDPLRNENEVPLPYVVTVDKGSGMVLAIRRNWKEADTTHQRCQHFVHYAYIPGFGLYGMGLIHIIGGYARAGTSIIRQLVDAGTLSNLPGGLKTKGLRVKGDDTPISPGEFRDVDVASGTLKDNVMPLPYKEPSAVLHALLQDLVEEGRRLGAISDIKISDMSSQMPVGTTLALLERTLKPMTAVQARIHYAMKQEFKLLAALMREDAPSDYDWQPDKADKSAKQTDYAIVEVIPVSDPNSATMAQRVVQFQAVQEMAKAAPQIFNLPKLYRQGLEILGYKNAAELVPTDEDVLPTDPVSENMGFLKGAPTKAFIFQNHDAHIGAHTAFMQDPMIAQMIGQNPLAQQMQSAIMAHIADHMAYQYRNQIEQQLGVPLPPPNEPMSPEIEVQLSALIAQAGQQLLQQHAAQAQQQQAAQQQQDPLYQLEKMDAETKRMKAEEDAKIKKADLKLKAMDLMRKMKKDKDDADLKELQIAKDEQRTGVMGRTQDINVQQQDRDRAQETFIEMMKLAQTNQVGSSGKQGDGNESGPTGP
jgi:hypothetical protein